MTDNRIGKSVTLNKKTDTTQYLWDITYGLPQVLTESDGKGTTLYSYGLGRISMADPRKGQMYYQYDGLGSVRGLTDRKGMTKGLYAYDVFGKPLISASTVDNDFQYTGEQVDDETGLIYLRSRYYDPEIGRFISRDSFAGFDTSTQSLNRYTYVQNNPVMYADPSGMVVWWAPGVAGAVINAGWYTVMDTNIGFGHQDFSAVKFGGRAAGGFAAGTVGSIVLGYTLANPVALIAQPYAAGAAAGGASYTADRYTQDFLAGTGIVPGTKDESATLGGGVIASALGVPSGGIAVQSTRLINPASLAPAIEKKAVDAFSVNSIYKVSSGSINNYYNNAAQSNQGPVRLGSGSIALPGGKLC